MISTLARATGSYWERRPVGPLQELFDAIWVHHLPEADALILVVPDGRIDLQFIGGAFRVAGPDREPQAEILAAGATVVGFRFRPGIAAAWLGVPAHEILNQRVLLTDLWGSRARTLAATTSELRDLPTLVRVLEGIVARRPPERRPVDAGMGAAYDLLATGAPEGRSLVSWLAAELAMSERTLRRRFEMHFGYGPKTLDRILRYQRFLRLAARAKDRSGAELALEAGYADQPHLIRESRRLTRHSPGEMARLAMRPIERAAELES